MITKTENWVSDIYWYEIIKKILSETKQYLFTKEIWQKMKDEYGYSYNIDRVERELSNLQRSGYAVSIFKREKQAWMYPTGEKLLQLEEHKIVDSAITEFLSESNRMPTVEELCAKIKEPINRETVSKRLIKISKITDLIDKIIKKNITKNIIDTEQEKKAFPEIKPADLADRKNALFYNSIINELDGAIGEIDILMIVTLIDTRIKIL